MISDLRLQHFRSYTDTTFQFNPGVTIIVGPNASGKTNLLEAILVIARGSSYRVHDQDLIQFEQPWARLDAETDSGHRTFKLTAEPPAKSYELDGKPYKRLTLAHNLPIVLFEPNHLGLLTGPPDQRRAYLDDLLEQAVAHYGTARRDYRRVLAQRNALLKRTHKPTNEELFPWNLRLSELGATIARTRNTMAMEINASLPLQYRSLTDTDSKLSLRYHTHFGLSSYETLMLQKLEQNLSLDTLRGFTTTGPHREDFTIFFGDHSAADTASRGELRSAILALKTIELTILEQARQISPLLLLDDVFSELDSSRRQALATYLERYQTFITTTDADMLSKKLTVLTQVLELT